MVLTNQQKLAYYRRQHRIKQIVLNRLRKSKNLLTGGKAVNRHLPEELRRATLDYDILIKKKGLSPAQAAAILERKLDKGFGGDYFKTKKGLFPGVHKVISNVTQGEVADYVRPDKIPKYKTDIDGVNIVSLDYLKKKFRESLARKEDEWRHPKDKEALQRISLAKQKVTKKKDFFSW